MQHFASLAKIAFAGLKGSDMPVGHGVELSGMHLPPITQPCIILQSMFPEKSLSMTKLTEKH